MGEPALDPEELLERLKHQNRALGWTPLPPDTPRRSKGVDHFRTKKPLEYLHQHWALPDAFDPLTAGGGPKGKILAMFGRLTFRVLGPYFQAERNLLAHLVRVNEALEQQCVDLASQCQQLAEDVIDRQVAEAENLTELALWLQSDPPEHALPDTRSDYKAEPGSTVSPS